MEESNEAQSEDNKVSQDNKQKRKLKSPAQLLALEKFYREHKYPTEEMKSDLAEQLGLTEKQVSGWFCHRRLKDKRMSREEKHANGRQDRSSGVIQDHGSGLGQDSCGSTKHGDRHIDPREVESHRLYGHDFPAADLSRDLRSHYARRASASDDTSSESSLPLHDRLYSQNEDIYGVETSNANDGVITVINPKGSRNLGYRPSGYLKVKGELENAAITAVKRQLGRDYRMDGPPLGVEFDPLPPGAFESPVRGPVHEPCFVGNPILAHSPEISGAKREPSPSTRYEVYDSKLSSRNSYIQEVPGFTHGVDHLDVKPFNETRRKSAHLNHASSVSGQNSSLDVYDGTLNNSNGIRRKGSIKHGVEQMISDSIFHHGRKIASNQGLAKLNKKIVQKSEHLKLKPPRSMHRQYQTPDMDDRGPSTIISKDVDLDGEDRIMEDYYNTVKVKTEPTNETMVGKRVRVDCPSRDYVATSSLAEIPIRKNHVKRSATEMPSSLSEDETAETDSSVD